MFAVIRILLLVFALPVFVSPGHGQNAGDGDQAAGVAAIQAAQAGDWNGAYTRASQTSDPLVGKLVRWLDYTRTNAAGRFLEIATFIDQNPDWPLQKTMRKRAEEALASEADDVAADWLTRNPPTTAIGKAREAELLAKRNGPAGIAALRNAWIEGDFSPTEEQNFASRFAAILRAEDHARRLDRLLWDGQNDAARRMLSTVPAEARTAAEARLALAAVSNAAEAQLARLSTQQRAEPGVAFEEARWRRKQDNTEAAAQLLAAHGDNPTRPAAWWGERQIVARRLIAAHNPSLAYRIIQPHGLTEGAAYSDAEFLCGYIALRYMKDPARAFDHFAHILARAGTPFAKARAAYWGGRAAQASGKGDLAGKWYAAGADHMATFYGQLAAHQLGNNAPPKPLPEPRPDSAELTRFNARETVRAAKLFLSANDREHARAFLIQMADSAKTPVEFSMLAAVAESYGRVDLAIAVARKSIDAGVPLLVRGYPVTTLPSGGTAERALLLAIVRQESAFAPDALSRAGARGLMQLMPGTAAMVSRKLQLAYSADRLISDGIYNILLGRAYIEGLIDDFGGSYALAIAGYNAGPGRVRQWLREYGDPRGRDVEMVDWIENIPFTETRIYVQRVLENLQIYRGQEAGNAAAFSLASDLAR